MARTESAGKHFLEASHRRTSPPRLARDQQQLALCHWKHFDVTGGFGQKHFTETLAISK